MKWCFFIYWAFYGITYAMECLIAPMTLDIAKHILAMYWLSFGYLAIVPMFYYFVGLEMNESYLLGFIGLFLARFILKIIAIYGYSGQRFDIAITGAIMLMWVILATSRGFKQKLRYIETNLL